MILVIGGILIGNMAKTDVNKSDIDRIRSEFRAFQDMMNTTTSTTTTTTTTPRNTDVDKALQDIAENTQGLQGLVDVLRIIASRELEMNLVVKSSSGSFRNDWNRLQLILKLVFHIELQLAPIADKMKPFLALVMVQSDLQTFLVHMNTISFVNGSFLPQKAMWYN